MHSDIVRRRRGALAGALALAALILAGCSGDAERQSERAGERAREDARGMRDFLGDRGVRIDTRLPER